jgi:hypothetical protein
MESNISLDESNIDDIP